MSLAGSRTVARAAALLAIGLLLGGCGNGRLGEQEYLARGDKLCARVTATAQRFGPARNVHQLGRKDTRVGAATANALRQFRGLRPPRRLERKAGVYLRLLGQRVVMLRRVSRAALAGDFLGTVRLEATRRQLDFRSNLAAADVGFEKCAAPVK